MVWGPIYLAVFFGLLVSAMLYFIFFWPAREPADDAPGEAETSPAAAQDPDSAEVDPV